MAKFLVQKSGPLHGEVEISGSKNAVLPILAAALLSEEDCVLEDVPGLKDVDIICSLLEALGASVHKDIENHKVKINSKNITSCVTPEELVKKMRASILVMGPLLARKGKATIQLPGGCAIGDRPVELHFKGLRALGANIDISPEGTVTADCNKLVADRRASCRERV